MKKILLMAAIGAMTFVSCNDDDDNSSSTDCFTCSSQGVESKFCHEGDDSTFEVTIAGVSMPDQSLPEGTTWEEYKASMTETEDCN